MSYDALFDRRAFLAVTTGILVAGAAAQAAAARAAAGPVGPNEVYVFYDPSNESRHPDLNVVSLYPGDDPVRVWARDVAPRLRSGVAVVGVTPWSDYVLFRGLAAEARLKLVREEVVAIDGLPRLTSWRFA